MMKYKFTNTILDKVLTFSKVIDPSAWDLVYEFLCRINSNKIDISQSYIDINEHEKPYMEIKIFSLHRLVSPIEICMYGNCIEISIFDVSVIESFTIETKKDKIILQKVLSKWLEHRIKEILSFKGEKLIKRSYKYYYGNRFKPLYSEINFIHLFCIGRKKENIYEPWIE